MLELNGSSLGDLPLCPERPPDAAVCLTSGTVWLFLQLAEGLVSLEHIEPSESPVALNSCNGNKKCYAHQEVCMCCIEV